MIADTSRLGPSVQSGRNLRVGHHSLVGLDGPVTIGDDVSIGHNCLIEAGVVLGNSVVVDSYCRIAAAAVVGSASQVLYGAKVFERVRIGARCVVAGSLMDDAHLGDDVTYMGEMAHSYRDPGDVSLWDDGEVQRSISIGNRSVVGERALLVGGITIGARCYVAAGEVVRCDLPDDTVMFRGRLVAMKAFRGLIKPRS